METIGGRLKALRHKRKLSQARLASMANVSQGTIGNIESELRGYGESIVDIAAALETTPAYLRLETDVEHSTSNAIPAALGARRVPVRGHARLGESGYYEEVDSPDGQGDGWVGYSSDPSAYALRVKGDRLHPAIRDGQFVVIEPGSACTVGEYVRIALKDGQKMIKELIIERPGEIVIESVNGGHRQTLEQEMISSINPIAAVVARGKWQPG